MLLYLRLAAFLLAFVLPASFANAKCYPDATGGGQTCEVIPVPSVGVAGDLATSAKQDTTNAALGATTGAAVSTDANGTIQQYLRGLVVLMGSANPVLTYRSDTYLNVAAGTATTVVKSGAGTLARISINTKGASANVITVYDNTAGSGTKIATIDGTSDRDHVYDVAFATGLTIVSATGTGADYTVAYR